MRDSIVVGEVSLDWSNQSDLARLSESAANAYSNPQVSMYRLLDGPNHFNAMIIYEFPILGRALSAVDDVRIALELATRHRVAAYTRIWRMARAESDRSPVEEHQDDAPLTREELLTVRLPAPAAESRWNRWYDTEHMPSVLSQVQAIEVGHRYAPVGAYEPGHYYVFYEFSDLTSLSNWQESPEVTERKREYSTMWDVENERRAFRRIADRAGTEK